MVVVMLNCSSRMIVDVPVLPVVGMRTCIRVHMSSDVRSSGVEFRISRLHNDAKGFESLFLLSWSTHLDRNQGRFSGLARGHESLLVHSDRLGAGTAPFGADQDWVDTDFVLIGSEGQRRCDDVQHDEAAGKNVLHFRDSL